MTDKKITDLTNITGADLVDADEFVVVDISADETKAITLSELKEAFDSGTGFVRITGDTMTGDLSVPNVVVSGNVDGRDVSSDGTKLDGIEAGADVTDTYNVTAAGALMDSEVTNLAQVKAFDETDYATAAQGALAASATQPGDLATVATSGAYSDLSGTPTLGTAAATASTDYATAAQGVTADAALPKAGGSMTGVIAGFQSTGIDDNATSTAMTLDTSGRVGIGTVPSSNKLEILTDGGGQLKLLAWDQSTTAEADIDFWYLDAGGSPYQNAQISAVAAANAGNGNLVFSTRPTSGSLTERMRLDSSGALLLGTTSRSIYYNSVNAYNASAVIKTNVSNEVADLVITNGDNNFGSAVEFARTNSAGNDVRFASISAQPTNNTAGSEAGVIRFYTKDTGDSNIVERMRLDASGNVGIGTSLPSVLLDARIGTTTGKVAELHNSVGYGIGFTVEGDGGVNTINAESNQALAFATNGASNERMRLDSSGNVGIGTSSPNDKLTISGSAAYMTIDRSDGEAGVTFRYNGDNTKRADIATQTNGDLRFRTNLAERMRIDSSGNLLVGSTNNSPATNNVAGSSHGSLGNIQASVDGNPCLFVNRKSNDGDIISIRQDGSAVGSISVTGSSTSYNTSSDYRLKTDAQPMTGASARVQALNPVNFEWLSDGTRVDGFLAHEAQAIVPEAVTGTKDAMRDEEYEVTPAVLDDDGNVVTEAVMGTRSVPDYQGIDQSKLVPLLTAALQEALTEISDLKARVTALEG